MPEYPAFKPLALEDRPVIMEYLAAYRPETSELTFTNLFIWRHHFWWEWSVLDGLLLLVSPEKPHTLPGDTEGVQAFGMMPVGLGPRIDAVRELFRHLADVRGATEPAIRRADRRLADELSREEDIVVEACREHFDYVYAVADLAALSGRKYHSKKNFVNRFKKEGSFRYDPVDASNISQCRELVDCWCEVRRCEDDLNLMGEWDAVYEALDHIDELSLTAGAVVIDNRVAAFSLGELLTHDTAVTHIEKADPDIPGLYALINQQFCENEFAEKDGAVFMNREQDLGVEGLRRAKESYHPVKMVEKFTIRPR